MKAPLGIHTITGPGPIIKAKLLPPNSTNGINLYQVFVSSNGTAAGNCNITDLSSPLTCTIGALEGEQNYTISAFSCIAYNETIIRSTKTVDSFFLPCKRRALLYTANFTSLLDGETNSVLHDPTIKLKETFEYDTRNSSFSLVEGFVHFFSFRCQGSV